MVNNVLDLFMFGVCRTLSLIDTLLLHQLPGNGVGGISHYLPLLGNGGIKAFSG